ncbi:MAG TPA: LysM peptidoglycan-binding domain-containing protein [Elusimicrobiales bacterium]|nr:LysM peptidoglycan-binding domain-containing protein [Elusimicrobiales bacterium]
MCKKYVAILALLFAPALAAAGEHLVTDGDTLWDLAGKYCGQPFQWEKLYEANKSVIKDPHWIYPKMKLDIPSCGLQTPAPLAVPEAKPVAEPEMKSAPTAESAVAQEKKPASVKIEEAEETAVELDAAAPEPSKPAEGREVVSKGNYTPMTAPKMVVSDRMPKDMTWGIPSSEAERLTTDWKADGKVRYANMEDKDDDLADLGDVIQIKITSGVKLKPGDYLKLYRMGVPEKDANGKVVALLAQHSALVKVTSVDGSKVLGEIVRLFNPVEKDDLAKKL